MRTRSTASAGQPTKRHAALAGAAMQATRVRTPRATSACTVPTSRTLPSICAERKEHGKETPPPRHLYRQRCRRPRRPHCCPRHHPRPLCRRLMAAATQTPTTIVRSPWSTTELVPFLAARTQTQLGSTAWQRMITEGARPFSLAARTRPQPTPWPKPTRMTEAAFTADARILKLWTSIHWLRCQRNAPIPSQHAPTRERPTMRPRRREMTANACSRAAQTLHAATTTPRRTSTLAAAHPFSQVSLSCLLNPSTYTCRQPSLRVCPQT